MEDEKSQDLSMKLIDDSFRTEINFASISAYSSLSSPTGSATKIKKPFRTFGIDASAFDRYKRVLRKRVAWSFVVMFVVVIQRIFSSFMRSDENEVVVFMQNFFGITYETSKQLWYFSFMRFIENDLYLFLLVTHFYVTVYYLESATTSLKIMFVHINAMVFITILQILFGEPRPFWDDPRIVAASCPGSYTFPSYSAFCILFLFLYSLHCIFEDEQEEDWTTGEVIKIGAFLFIYVIFSFFKVLAGYDYVSQMFLAWLYAILIYYPAVFFDKSLTSLVENTTLHVTNAKRYTIYWLIYIILLTAFASLFYAISDPFIGVDWYKNYFVCLNEIGAKDIYKLIPFDHFIGAWGSYTKSAIMYMLLGAIFGAAKTFRDFGGVLWYATSDWNKRKMAFVANLCIVPSWIIYVNWPKLIRVLEEGGYNEYLFYAVNCMLMFYVTFGILPYYVFRKWGWTRQDDHTYEHDHNEGNIEFSVVEDKTVKEMVMRELDD